MTTVVVDHGRANLFSLRQALLHLGISHEASADPTSVESATRLFLPGVGAFGDVMNAIRRRGLIGPIRNAIERRVPLLGICVGMQILADSGEEFGQHAGLGIWGGVVRRLPESRTGDCSMRIPNVGWRQLHPRNGKFSNLRTGDMAYFVHSYALSPINFENVEATFQFNGVAFPAIVRRGNVVGFQFHPEKSGPVGLSLIERFMAFTPEGD